MIHSYQVRVKRLNLCETPEQTQTQNFYSCHTSQGTLDHLSYHMNIALTLDSLMTMCIAGGVRDAYTGLAPTKTSVRHL